MGGLVRGVGVNEEGGIIAWCTRRENGRHRYDTSKGVSFPIMLLKRMSFARYVVLHVFFFYFPRQSRDSAYCFLFLAFRVGGDAPV